MTTSATHSTEHLVRRLNVALPLPYDRAVRRYEELIPAADLTRFGQVATWDAVLEFADRWLTDADPPFDLRAMLAGKLDLVLAGLAAS